MSVKRPRGQWSIGWHCACDTYGFNHVRLRACSRCGHVRPDGAHPVITEMGDALDRYRHTHDRRPFDLLSEAVDGAMKAARQCGYRTPFERDILGDKGHGR